MKYIIQVRDNPAKHELRFALRLTVTVRSNGTCEHCGKVCKPDMAHIKPPNEFPKLEFEPSNVLALCRSCHLKIDHKLGNRKSGRPKGFKHSEETKRKIGIKSHAAHSTPEGREALRQRVKKQWDRQGRKYPSKPCEYCRKIYKANGPSRFCSAECHYDFRRGKPRSGY